MGTDSKQFDPVVPEALSADFLRYELVDGDVIKTPIHLFARHDRSADLVLHWCPITEGHQEEIESRGNSMGIHEIKQMVVGRSSKVFQLDKPDPDTCISLWGAEKQLHLKSQTAASLVTWFKHMHKLLLASGRKHAVVQKKYEPDGKSTVVNDRPAGNRQHSESQPLEYHLETLSDIIRSTIGFPVFVDVDVPKDAINVSHKIPLEEVGEFDFLIEGKEVINISSDGSASRSLFIFNPELSCICWRNVNESTFSPSNSIPLQLLTDVYLGPIAPSFKNFKGELQPDCCFTLKFGDVTLDLQVDQPATRTLWVTAINESTKYESVYSSQLAALHWLNASSISMFGYDIQQRFVNQDTAVDKLQKEINLKHKINEVLWTDLHKLQTIAYVIYHTSLTHPETQRHDYKQPERPPNSVHGLIRWLQHNIGDVFAEQSRLCYVVDKLAKQKLAAVDHAIQSGKGYTEGLVQSVPMTIVNDNQAMSAEHIKELLDKESEAATKMLVLARRVVDAEYRASIAEGMIEEERRNADAAYAAGAASAASLVTSTASTVNTDSVAANAANAAATAATAANANEPTSPVVGVRDYKAAYEQVKGKYLTMKEQHKTMQGQVRQLAEEVRKNRTNNWEQRASEWEQKYNELTKAEIPRLNAIINKQQADATRQQALLTSMKKMQITQRSPTAAADSNLITPTRDSTPRTVPVALPGSMPIPSPQTLMLRGSEERINQLKRERLALRNSVVTRTQRLNSVSPPSITGSTANGSPSANGIHRTPATEKSTKRSGTPSTAKSRRKKSQIVGEKSTLEASLKDQEARIMLLKQQKAQLVAQKYRAVMVADAAYAAASSSASETTDDDLDLNTDDNLNTDDELLQSGYNYH